MGIRTLIDRLLGRKYLIWVDEHRVFVHWYKRIEKWSDSACQDYLKELQSRVRATVSPEIWQLLTLPEPCDNPEYQAYVQSVRDELIREYRLENVTAQVTIDTYHYETLVISFPVRKGITYPHHFRGIHLKPWILNSSHAPPACE